MYCDACKGCENWLLGECQDEFGFEYDKDKGCRNLRDREDGENKD